MPLKFSLQYSLPRRYKHTHTWKTTPRKLPLFEDAALRVAATFAFSRADERIVAGIFVWAARDCTTPDEAFSNADCSWS